MNDCAQKLRSLARQSRALSGTIQSGQRAAALEALAKLYEKQAKDLELADPTRTFSERL
jgi:hypothetical protein